MPAARIIANSEHGLVIRDAYPISAGHTLIIPRRHVGSFFDVSSDERADLLGLLDVAEVELDRETREMQPAD